MKRTLAKINCDGDWKVVHDDTRNENPYIVYHCFRVLTESGYRKRERQIKRCGDYANALQFITNVVAALKGA